MRFRRLLVFGGLVILAVLAFAILMRARDAIYRTVCDAAAGETVLACLREWQGIGTALILLLLGIGFLLALRGQIALLRLQSLQIRRQFAEHLRHTTEGDRRVVLRETTRLLEKLDRTIARIAQFEKDVENDPGISNDPVRTLRTRLSQLEALAGGDGVEKLADYLGEEEMRNVRELMIELRVQISLLDKVLPKFETALSTLKPESQEHRRMMRQVYAEMQNLHLSKQETVLARARTMFENLSSLRGTYQDAWYMKETGAE